MGCRDSSFVPGLPRTACMQMSANPLVLSVEAAFALVGEKDLCLRFLVFPFLSQARYKQEGIPESLWTITATAEDNAKVRI